MKLRKHIKKIMAVGCIALLGATMVGCADVRLSTEEYERDIASAKASVDITTDNAEVIAEAVNAVDITTDNERAVNGAIAAITKEEVPDAIQEEILKDAADAAAKVDADTEAKGYTLDELKIGAEFNKTLSDRELDIFDGEIDFDGDDYDAEEIFSLTNLKVAANEEDDSNTDTFLQIPEAGIRFAIQFASNLNVSLIEEDETLEFSFLGEEVEVSEWNGNKITFSRGTEIEFNEGQEQTIDGKVVKVSTIHVVDETGYVKVYVDGVGKKIYEGSTRKINGLDIKVIEVVVDDDVIDTATLETGEDVEVTVKDGEEYADDSIWDYVVDGDAGIFGLVLNEEHMSIDEDEDFKALAVGDSISLPNDYITVTYNGLTVEDTEDYDFKLKTKNDVDYVMVKGEFLNGIEDYSRIYLDNASNILNDDYEFIVADSIELADTDLTLNTDGTAITIELDGAELVKTNFILSMLEADGEDISTEDEDYITNYGIVIKDPDDNLEDNELEIVIPEEELEAEIFITSK